MSVFEKVLDKIGGGIIKEGFDVIREYFPSEKERAAAELAYNEFAHKKDVEIRQTVNEAEKNFNQRIKDLEGSAADLKTIPIIGKLVIFIRGCQRPAWGIFVLYADYMTFSKTWAPDEQQRAMLFAINILVLGFLFGERAVKNILPFVKEFIGVRGKQ